MIQNENNLDVNQRVGVVQTHNEKGETCGRVILVGELDQEVGEKLRMFDTFKEFIRTYIAFSVGNADYLNWDHPKPLSPEEIKNGPKVIWKLGEVDGKQPTEEELNAFRKILQAQAHDPRAAIIVEEEKHGVCPWCDYGGGQGLAEHEKRCDLRQAVEWMDGHDPVFPKQAKVPEFIPPAELKAP